MPVRSRLLAVVLGPLLVVLAGCSDDPASDRVPGDEVTTSEAEVLAGVLYRDFERGGADFVLTAPYAQGTVLTLTGQVDFAAQTGHADVVTSHADGRPDDTRTVYFDAGQLWTGDVPGLSEAMAGAGAPGITYLRRPIAAEAGGSPTLLDVLVRLVPRLSARTADDPQAILDRHYTWQGQRSIDGQLAVDYRTAGGATVSVASSSKLLLQYVTPLPQQPFAVTMTLSDHGAQQVDLPPDSQTAAAGDYPAVAAELGI